MSWKNVQYENGKCRTSEGGGGGASNFADLNDVSFSNLQNGQVPKYNSTTQKWENANESGGGSVTDVEVDGVSVVNQQGVAEITTPEADGIAYDNQQSGLQATDVQSAIDELAQGSGGGGVEDVEVNGTSVVNAQNVAEITSYKEVTLAEYQALPSSKLSDGVMYCINDVGGADEFPPLIFSTEEREVGVWTDGKPLYEKTISLGSVSRGSSTQIDLSSLSISRIISYNGNAIDDDDMEIPIPYVHNSNIVNQVLIRYAKSSGIMYLLTGSGKAVSNAYVTIKYTKTTDVAGSGTWTTDGSYAHHYSTTEQVVGTWIDGKPLYEKTIWKSGVSAGTEQNLITISDVTQNIGLMVKYGVSFYDSDKAVCINAGYYENSNYCAYARFTNSAGFRTYIKWGSSSFSYLKVICQYTKTTD